MAECLHAASENLIAPSGLLGVSYLLFSLPCFLFAICYFLNLLTFQHLPVFWLWRGITQMHTRCDIMQAMRLHRSLRKFGKQVEESVGLRAHEDRHILRAIGWVSAGVTALAIGVVVGRELRQRHKFNNRTPYDFYAHSGDEIQDVEFGVGI